MKRLVKVNMDVVLELRDESEEPVGMHVLHMGDFEEMEYVDDGINVADMLKSRGNQILFTQVDDEVHDPKGGISLP